MNMKEYFGPGTLQTVLWHLKRDGGEPCSSRDGILFGTFISGFQTLQILTSARISLTFFKLCRRDVEKSILSGETSLIGFSSFWSHIFHLQFFETGKYIREPRRTLPITISRQPLVLANCFCWYFLFKSKQDQATSRQRRSVGTPRLVSLTSRFLDQRRSVGTLRQWRHVFGSKEVGWDPVLVTSRFWIKGGQLVSRVSDVTFLDQRRSVGVPC